ncbi:MAG: hypothetical protein JNM25_02520 [Planctomycetes bacterium]|nr:hypothetical protein [Planctomycetota bacterium]
MLAACVGVAGWAGLLALRRDAGPDGSLGPIAPIVQPPPPQRLPAAPEFARNALPAAGSRATSVATVAIRIPAVPAALRGAGVAIYDARTGAEFTWLPLDGGEPGADGSLTLQSTTRVRGDLQVALAAAPEWARHSYLARTSVEIGPAAAGTPTLVDLPVVVDSVQIVLPDAAGRAGPLRLSRCDDAQWLPMFHAATGIEILPGAPTTVLLGAGAYELVDPIDATRRQRFEVPRAGAVVLTPTLTAVRADRP